MIPVQDDAGPGDDIGRPPSLSSSSPSSTSTLILYDGECGLCDRFVSFVIARDGQQQFRFAALQSSYAARLLAAKGRAVDVDRLDTLIVVTPGGDLLERSAGPLFVLRRLGVGWRALALLRFLPVRLRDWGYRQVARRRYRLWGRLPACRIPSAAERARFLDASVDAAVPESQSR